MTTNQPFEQLAPMGGGDPLSPGDPDGAANKLAAQFKVKPASALMPDDKKVRDKVAFKKKNRKSPIGSPHPPIAEQQPMFGIETPTGMSPLMLMEIR